jgi:hypothetical protein
MIELHVRRLEAENIAGLLRGFLPVRRRGAGEVRFQRFLAKAQGAFVGFHSASNRRRSVAF